MKDKQIVWKPKVYAMSDEEWVAALDIQTALIWYLRETGLTNDDMEDQDYPAEVSESEMLRLQFEEDDGSKKSFRQKLSELVADPTTEFPTWFAFTDY